MGLFQYVSGGKFFSTVSIYVNLSVYCEYRCDEVLSFLTSMFLRYNCLTFMLFDDSKIPSLFTSFAYTFILYTC